MSLISDALKKAYQNKLKAKKSREDLFEKIPVEYVSQKDLLLKKASSHIREIIIFFLFLTSFILFAAFGDISWFLPKGKARKVQLAKGLEPSKVISKKKVASVVGKVAITKKETVKKSEREVEKTKPHVILSKKPPKTETKKDQKEILAKKSLAKEKPERVVLGSEGRISLKKEISPKSASKKGKISKKQRVKKSFDEASLYFSKALSYHERGEIKLAKIFYKKYIKIHPENAEAHNNLGLVYKDEGKFYDAISEFQIAIFLDRYYDKAYNNLGAVYYLLGDLEKARKNYEMATKLNPDNKDAFVNLGIIYKKEGRFEDAEKMYEKALFIDPKMSVAYYNLAVLCDEEGRFKEALNYYEKFLDYAGDTYKEEKKFVLERVSYIEKLIKSNR